MAAEAELPQLLEAREELLSARRTRLRRVTVITSGLFTIVIVMATMAFFYEQRAFVEKGRAQQEAEALFLTSPVVAVGPYASISQRGWLVEDGRPASQIAASPVTLAVFGPDGRLFAAADQEGVVVGRVVLPGPADRLEIVARLPVPTPVTSLRFAPDATRLAATSADGSASLWDIQTGREVAKLQTGKSGATTASFSPDASMCAVGKRDGSIVLWSTADSRVIASFRMQAPISSIAFSADQHSLLIGFNSGGYAVIAVGDGKQLDLFPG